MRNFKSNVLSLENSFENLTAKEEHHDIVKKSFNLKDESSPSSKIKNGNQLWVLLDKLNNKKVQLKGRLEEEKIVVKKRNYVSGLASQVRDKDAKIEIKNKMK